MIYLKRCLEKIDYISLTTDLWKNKKLEYFLTLTGHFLTMGYKFNSMILSFRKFTVRHTADNITKFNYSELNKLNIIDKIVAITRQQTITDNEAAVASACSHLGGDIKRISCMNHNLNLVIKNGLKLWV
jgi:hypothetical protein